MIIPFTKMHGLGNDYVYVDCRAGLPVPQERLPDLARRISDRHRGVGSDGLILVLPSRHEGAAFGFRMFNRDGSEAEMCGNGMRCFARYVVSRGLTDRLDFAVGTPAGLVGCQVEPGEAESPWLVRCDLGIPRLAATEVPTLLPPRPDGAAVEVPVEVLGRRLRLTAVSMGVPHAVAFLDRHEFASFPWQEAGQLLESHAAFPRKTNVEFAAIESEDRVAVRVWERGAGPTLACGTGACAVVVAGALTGRLGRAATVVLPGGEVRVRWRQDDGHVELEGPAAEVCTGGFLYGPPDQGACISD